MSEYTLHLGDCLDFMRGMDTGSVGAAITDPPYGISLKTNYRDNQRGNLAPCNNFFPIVGDDKPFDPAPFLQFKIVALFGANNYASKLPDTTGWIVWDKRDGMTSNDQSDCELIWTNQNVAARVYRHRWNGMIKDSERQTRRVHPTQKPVALMVWLISQLRIPKGATIFDPFMGSGSTGVACMQLGRNFIGCEIDPGYFAIAQKRISEAAAQPALFHLDAPRIEHTQGAFA